LGSGSLPNQPQIVTLFLRQPYNFSPTRINQGGTHLIAGRAAGLEGLGVVAAAVHASIPVEVDEVHEELAADAAGEARRMPAGIWAQSRGEHGDVARGN